MATEKDNPALILTEQADGSALVEDPSDLSAGHEEGGQEGAQEGGEGGDSRTTSSARDEQVDHNLNDAEREAIRERRRQERANKKASQRERETTLRQELATRDEVIRGMQERLASIDNRNSAADVAQLDNAIQRASGAVEYFKGVIEEGTKKQDGRTVADATLRLTQAQNEASRLTQVRHSFVQQAGAPQPTDPAVAAMAQQWASRHPWYDPSGKEMDSSIVLTIDRQVSREGFDPRSQGYWDELSQRVDRYLPHRAVGEHNGASNTSQRTQSRTPVSGSGREGGAGNGSRSGSTFQLSAARVQALKDAGVWDDPKARSDMIRRYRDHDRQTQQAADRG